MYSYFDIIIKIDNVLDSLQPVRKISIVSPVTTHAHQTGIDVFFGGSGPTGLSTNNQNSSNLLEVIGTENTKVCDDIKDWWIGILEAR